jgi:hypothetical protein
MRKLLLLIICAACNALYSQDLSFSKHSNNLYQELTNPASTPVEEWSKVICDINVSFGSDNVRYPKEKVPLVSSKEWTVTAWKGEKVHTQILVWSKKEIPFLSFQAGDLMDENGYRIDSKNLKAAFVRYIMTDEYGEAGCIERLTKDYDSSLVEDPIDITDRIPVQANTVQPIWLTVQVPGDTPAGKYSGIITINAEEKIDLKISLNVLNHLLPPPSQWKFDLDLWQSPNPIAKVHDVKLWSDEHFELMKPYFTMLANAGQKTITANIINRPWGPTHTYYEEATLINWIRKKDGSWSYDYSIFDRYISMMISCGINKHINCYSMVSWNLTYPYFDEVTGKETMIELKPGSPEFTEYWTTMLKDFTKHLKEKGWFEMAAIAMDERDPESMKSVFALLKTIDPGWKTALAGFYHDELEKDIYDYCIIESEFPDSILSLRKAQGKPSTFYTCCNPERPNGFTFSPPAENTWLSWFAASEGYTGYLRWAYNNWSEATLFDTRFRSWPAGDCYLVYPGPRSSIRFEKLIEGIQDFEKIRILKDQLLKVGNKEVIKELDNILATFKPENLVKTSAADMVSKAKEFLNKY